MSRPGTRLDLQAWHCGSTAAAGGGLRAILATLWSARLVAIAEDPSRVFSSRPPTHTAQFITTAHGYQKLIRVVCTCIRLCTRKEGNGGLGLESLCEIVHSIGSQLHIAVANILHVVTQNLCFTCVSPPNHRLISIYI